MKVTAKCTYDAWDSIACMRFYPGQEYEIEHDGALAALKTPTGRYVFQFDRDAERSSVSSSVAPTASPAVEITLPSAGEAAPLEAQEEPKVDRRGKTPPRCKGCGESFPNVNVLVRHKKVCPAKVEAVSEQAPQEATV